MGWFFSLGLSLCLFWPLSQWLLTILNHWKSSCRCWPHFFFNLSLAGWEERIVGVSPTPLSSVVSLLSLLVSVTEEEEKKFPRAKRSWFVSSSAMDMWSSVSRLDSWNLIQNGNNHSTCLDPSGANQETEATQRWNREAVLKYNKWLTEDNLSQAGHLGMWRPPFRLGFRLGWKRQDYSSLGGETCWVFRARDDPQFLGTGSGSSRKKWVGSGNWGVENLPPGREIPGPET